MQLAEVNVALARAPLGAPAMASFLKAFDGVNGLADSAPGFVWRLRPQHGHVTLGRLEGDDVIVTLSVWEDFDALQRYVFRSGHGLFMRQRARWFVPLNGFTTALWWVADGEQPSADEALDRLRHLRLHGPTPHAFSLRRQFDPAGVPERR